MGRLQSSHAQRLSLIVRPNCCAAKYLGIEIQLDLSKQGYASARVDCGRCVHDAEVMYEWAVIHQQCGTLQLVVVYLYRIPAPFFKLLLC